MSTNYSKSRFSPHDWISQAEAARFRGVTRQAIYKLIKSGRLQTLEVGGRLLVNKREILNFEAEKAGRPKSDKK